MKTRHVTRLPAPSKLPEGRAHWFVEVAQDGLSRPIELPVMTLRGPKDGPVVALTAAVHGNELNGIRVIHRLFDKLDPAHLRGTIIGVTAVNVPGLLERTRELGGKDLNHAFPGLEDGATPHVYAHRVRERVLREIDVLIDLHTASFGRVNSLYVRADMTNDATAELAVRQRPDIIVHNPPADGTLRGAMARDGVPAITLEIGNPHRLQADFVRRALAGVRANLAALGMLRKRPRPDAPAPVLCESSRWMYTDKGGLLHVEKHTLDRCAVGEVLATLRNPFGKVIETYTAPFDSIVIGHSVDPVAETGARIAHLGMVAPDTHDFIIPEAW